MQEMHRKEIHFLECIIRQLKQELAQAHKELRANIAHWLEGFEDLEKEHRKEVAALQKQLKQMEKRDEAKDKKTSSAIRYTGLKRPWKKNRERTAG